MSKTNDEIIVVRIPSSLRDAVEKERRKMSERAGAEVKMSAVVRALLDRALRAA